MGKTREYSNDLHKSGNGYKKIGQWLKMPISTISAIIKKFKATGDVNNRPGKGRVSILTQGTVRRMVRVAKKSSSITAGELQTLVGSWGQKVSKTTIRRHPHNHKLFGRVTIKKYLLSSNNQLKCLRFAKRYRNFQSDRILWSDETKIELFGNTPERWVWCRQKDSHAEKYLSPTVKYGGGSLMLWGCFSSKGPGQHLRIHGIMDSKYQQILNPNLTAFARKLKLGRG